jgi:hypothetical protein
MLRYDVQQYQHPVPISCDAVQQFTLGVVDVGATRRYFPNTPSEDAHNRQKHVR